MEVLFNKVYRKDYQPPGFSVKSLYLAFDLHPTKTQVRARLLVSKRNLTSSDQRILTLNGEDLTLLEIKLDGRVLEKNRYQVSNTELSINDVPDQFELETLVEINPQANTQLSGLYLSNGVFCTQCEAHGFRRITYFLDRPDVLTEITTSVTGESGWQLLSNGNLIDDQSLPDGRSKCTWHDPSLKPCYLFALVAGELDCCEDQYTTMSGRQVALRLYLDQGADLAEGAFAIEALKSSMKWDEQVYGREYDLDIFMIVAVRDFNFGAMENKGLNVFNSKYILATPELATDLDYINVQAVVAHEYFHNWTGNRVTCRDWFELSLKEGLTVFRDQSFTADMTAETFKRIADVKRLEAYQFVEDAGPVAHAVRPDSYMEIDNLYTATVYEKGAEIIRMMHLILGKEKFRQATDLYFKRHDGQAVTIDELIAAVETAGEIDLTQFSRWYSQAGTPQLTIDLQQNIDQGELSITVKQQCCATKETHQKQPFDIPFKLGFIGMDSNKPVIVDFEGQSVDELLLRVDQPEQRFVFSGVNEPVVPSLLRGFSAPVQIDYDYNEEALFCLLQHDVDEFNRWRAGQFWVLKVITQIVKALEASQSPNVPETFLKAMAVVLTDQGLPSLLKAEMLTLPSESQLLQQFPGVDVDLICKARQLLITQMADYLEASFVQSFEDSLAKNPYQFNIDEINRRTLNNLCLFYLANGQNATDHFEKVTQHFHQADNLTDKLGALSAINSQPDFTGRQQLLDQFYQQSEKSPLLMDRWFGLQAVSTLPKTTDVVKSLLQHPHYIDHNPNRVRALLGGFAMLNMRHFHDLSGQGYALMAEQVVLMDAINAQLAAQLIRPLLYWQQRDSKRQTLMRGALTEIKQHKALSKNVYDMLSQSLEEEVK